MNSYSEQLMGFLLHALPQLVSILGLQPRDKAAMLGVKTKEFFSKNLHENRLKFPEERNAFVLDYQQGRRDVTCKPAIHSVSISTQLLGRQKISGRGSRRTMEKEEREKEFPEKNTSPISALYHCHIDLSINICSEVVI